MTSYMLLWEHVCVCVCVCIRNECMNHCIMQWACPQAVNSDTRVGTSQFLCFHSLQLTLHLLIMERYMYILSLMHTVYMLVPRLIFGVSYFLVLHLIWELSALSLLPVCLPCKCSNAVHPDMQMSFTFAYQTERSVVNINREVSSW